MKLKTYYIDGIEQEFEMLPYSLGYVEEYYMKNNCILFFGTKIDSSEGKDFIIPYNNIRWIEVEK